MKATYRVPHLKNWRSWAAAIAAGGLIAGLLAASNLASAAPLITDGVYGWGTTGSSSDTEPWQLDFDNTKAPFVDVAAAGGRSGADESTTLAVTADGDIVAHGDHDGLVSNMPSSLAGENVRAIEVAALNTSRSAAAAITEESGIVTWNGAPEPSQECQDQVADLGASDVQLRIRQLPENVPGRTNSGLVLLGDGSLCSWGHSGLVSATPVEAGFQKVAAGAAFAALKGGDVYIWDLYGARDLPAEIEQANIVDISVTGSTVWALTDTGEVLHSTYRDISNPFPDEPKVKGQLVALGETTVANGGEMLAVTDQGEFVAWGGDAMMDSPPAALEGYEVVAMSTANASHHAFIVGEKLEDVGPEPITVEDPPSITGDPIVGKTLEAEPATFSDTDGVDLTNQWYAAEGDGEPELIDGETGDTLDLTSELVGKTITYTTTAQRGDEDPVVSKPSNEIGPVEEGEPETLGVEKQPSIVLADDATEPRVGEDIEATVAEFNQESGLTIEHRWFRDDERIKDANSSAYTLTDKDIGAEITYRTHAERDSDGQTATSEESNSIGPVLPVKLEFTEPTVIKGSGYIGTEHTVSAGVTSDDENVDNTYEWTVTFDDDRDDVTADGDTFTPTEDERGGMITVTQTATRGDDSISQTSESVGPVRDAPADIGVESEAEIAVAGDEDVPFWGETLVGTPAEFDETDGVTVKNFWVMNTTEEVPAELDDDGLARMEIPQGTAGVIQFRSVAIRDGYDDRSGESTSDWMTGFKVRLEVESDPVIGGGDRPWVGKELSIESEAEFNVMPPRGTLTHRWIAIAEDGTEETVGTDPTLTLTEEMVGKKIVLEGHIIRGGGGGPGVDELTARSKSAGPVTEGPGPVEVVSEAEIAVAGDEEVPFWGEILVGTPAEFSETDDVTVKNFWVMNGTDEEPAELDDDGLARMEIPEGASGLISFRSVAIRDGADDRSGESTSDPIFGFKVRFEVESAPVIGGGDSPWVGKELSIESEAEFNVMPPRVTLTHRWIAIAEDGTEETVGTDSTLALTEEMVGKKIVLEGHIIRGGGGGPGVDELTARSETVGPIKAELGLDSPPEIDGTAQVGEILEGTPAVFNDDGADVDNQWLAGDVGGDPEDASPIDGATGDELELTADQVGKVIYFKSTAARGDEEVSSISEPTDAVASLPLKVTKDSQIEGMPVVGETITGLPAEFNQQVDASYQWNVDGIPEAGATSTTLKLTEKMVGKTITFVTTGTAGDASQASESKEFGPVKAKLAVDSEPSISGTAQVGETLTGTPAVFNDDDAEVSNAWFAGSDKVGTGTTLKVTRAMVGKKITFESTATRGDEAVTSESTPTEKVAEEAGGGEGEGPSEPDKGVKDKQGDISVLPSTTLHPGQDFAVKFDDKWTGKKVSVWMFSEKFDLGTHTVGENNRVAVTVPKDISTGAHKVAAYDADGDLIGWVNVKVVAEQAAGPGASAGGGLAGALPSTGSEWLTNVLAPAGVLLLLGGGGALLVSRRRRHA